MVFLSVVTAIAVGADRSLTHILVAELVLWFTVGPFYFIGAYQRAEDFLHVQKHKDKV